MAQEIIANESFLSGVFYATGSICILFFTSYKIFAGMISKSIALNEKRIENCKKEIEDRVDRYSDKVVYQDVCHTAQQGIKDTFTAKIDPLVSSVGEIEKDIKQLLTKQ